MQNATWTRNSRLNTNLIFTLYVCCLNKNNEIPQHTVIFSMPNNTNSLFLPIDQNKVLNNTPKNIIWKLLELKPACKFSTLLQKIHFNFYFLRNGIVWAPRRWLYPRMDDWEPDSCWLGQTQPSGSGSSCVWCPSAEWLLEHSSTDAHPPSRGIPR